MRGRASSASDCSPWAESTAIDLSFPKVLAVTSDESSSVSADGAYTISWTAMGHADHYEIQEKTRQRQAMSASAEVSAASNDYSGRLSFSSYAYRVRACNASDDCGGTWSDVYSVSVSGAAPTSFAVSNKDG